MTRQNQAERREREYGRNIRLAAVAALVVLTAGFLAVKPSEQRPYALRHDAEVLVIRPASTSIYEPPKPPLVVRPKLPVADPLGKESDSSVGRTTWDETDTVRFNPREPEPLPTYKVEVVPQPVHLEVPDYPELARQVGIEGRVTVKVIVDTTGRVTSAEILASSGNTLLDAAAKEAASKSLFTPGYQNGRPVWVWMAVPFVFKLQ